MAYDAANRLIKYNGEEVRYDADGNMIYGPLNGEMSEFVYDCRNRLVSAGGVTYEYDAENNRISKTAGETKTEYVIDTSNTLSHVLTATTGETTTYYVFGIGLLYQEEDGETLFYHFNNIGSTEAVTDESGQIVETFAYGPYGELLSANECGIMYLYNGEYGVATDENGLYYMRARYYNSEIKRFVNQDVLIGTISDSPTMNRYAYVNGNPISLADPFGLSPSLNWLGHAALDVLGLIPGFGAIFDLINAGWYFIEGDYFSAFCSIISVIPVVGDAIGLMGKGAKLACGVQKGLHIAANMGSLFKSTYVIGNVVRTNIERYLINGEEFSWSQLGVDLLTVGLEILAFKSAAKGLVEAENMQVCFVAGTLITTAEGYKAIEEIQAGDEVLAKDVETGEVAVKKVVQTFVNETDELVHVHVNGEEIISTPTHPFYVNQFGWTHAADLRAGDVLVLSNGEYVVVEFVQHEILEEPVKVYNFEVEDYHTYFVGKSSVLVHNTCPDTRLPRNNGHWEGKAGNGLWHSDNADVIKATNANPIPFSDNKPDFSSWSKGTITFEEGVLTGRKQDFSLVNKAIKDKLNFATEAQAYQWLKNNGLTAHHVSSTQIQLIPSAIHNNIPHIGSASQLRMTANNLGIKEIAKKFKNYGIVSTELYDIV